MERELSPTAFLNVLNTLNNERKRLQHEANATLHDALGVGYTGEYQFTLIDAETGEVEETRSYNTLVDEGENALLQFIGGITDNRTQTFTGDGNQTNFTLPYPYKPVENVVSVTDGGTTQTEHTDFSVDYSEAEVVFDSAPADQNTVEVEVDYYTHPWNWLAVGTDGTAVSESDTGLGSEDTRIGLDSGYFTRDESAVEITGQWTLGTGQANVSIAEAGLFNTPPSAAANGDILNRTVVSPTIDKSSSQELQVTWTLSMS